MKGDADLSDKQQSRQWHKGPVGSYQTQSFHNGLTSSVRANKGLKTIYVSMHSQ